MGPGLGLGNAEGVGEAAGVGEGVGELPGVGEFPGVGELPGVEDVSGVGDALEVFAPLGAGEAARTPAGFDEPGVDERCPTALLGLGVEINSRTGAEAGKYDLTSAT